MQVHFIGHHKKDAMPKKIGEREERKEKKGWGSGDTEIPL